MPSKNPYYVELKRYLAEVAVDRRALKLGELSKRVDMAYRHGTPSLDICELFVLHAQSSPRCRKTAVYPKPRSQPMILRGSARSCSHMGRPGMPDELEPEAPYFED